MQSKITQIEPKGTYTNASGTFNKYQVYLANGNNYQFLAKGDFKKNVGDTIDFEITNEQYNTAKLIYNKPIQAPSANREQIIVRQSMVKAAADFHASRPNADIQTVIHDAQLLINFVNNG
tara:strand:+ start:354 stop:713 length:360 start_codon:yes stop_codon:yes gene_type:complete